ncbi:MAG TPA: PfkB family carbohydrate kinase [Bryobacteraceae bacterium]|jgi:ribokinase
MSKTPYIVVVGSANIDLVTYTDDFPRPGETIFGREFSLGFGGKGANQAVAARLCGAEVSMVARVGDDLFGPATIESFRSYGIHIHRVLIYAGSVERCGTDLCGDVGAEPDLGGQGGE